MSDDNSHSNVAPAVLGSIASIGAGLWRGISNFLSPTFAQAGPATAENLPVFGAIVVGIMGIGWSIYSAGPNRLAQALASEVTALREQLNDKTATIKAQDLAMAASLTERNRLLSEIGRLEGQLSNAQARLTNNAQPTIIPPLNPA